MTLGHARDEDLLLLSHHALPFWRCVLTRAHLRVCTSCRLRQERLAHVSQLLAGVIREPSDPAWHPPINSAIKTLPLLLAAALLLTLCLTLLWSDSRPHPSTASHTFSVPCRPDLPNDRCR